MTDTATADHRLPRSILPRRYDVRIDADLEASRFTGRVRIEADVVEATDTLVCNSAELAIEELLVDDEARPYSLDEPAERLVVELGDRRSGPVVVEVAFTGTINDQLRGFYRSTFVDDDGVERVIGTTQFQSTDARRAFPCFDEPDMKATFAITLVVDDDLLAVSNGAELDRRSLDDGRVEVRFAETMPMSTYLVAFVVGPLEATEPAYARGTPVRVVHRPGRGHLADFALEVAVAAIEFFEDYYAIPYPADKVDMIALPDFAMGAMENLGCITYREVLLLVDPENATQPELQDVADVINHELAHMWFGDLVTMRWWNGIWLNEAFATFMEMKATDAFRPEWKRWTSFGLSRAQAFDIDSLSTTRAIEFPVHSPDDAEAMFDTLTYEKGAAVVRMLEQWLGEDVFRDGIRHYLATHTHGNTETHDLWQALEHVAGRPVTREMETWIFQGGYPVIEIDGQTIRQRRFTYGEVDDDHTWSIPVGIRATDGSVSIIELADAERPLTMPVSEIVTANHRGNGFYRVRLPGERLAELGRTGLGRLDPVERFALVDDTWAMTLSGLVGIDEFVALLDAYRDESDVAVWQRVVGALAFVRHVAPDDQLDRVGELVVGLTSLTRHRLGDEPAPDEDDRTRQLRGTLLAAVGTLSDDAEAGARAEQILDQTDPDSELLAAAVKVLAHRGDRERFEEFRDRFTAATNPQEEMRYLYALPNFGGEAEIEELTTMALDGRIRTQNAPFVLARAMMHRRHGPTVWRRVEQRWDLINERFPSNTIVRMLSGIRWLTDDDSHAAVRSFFAERSVPQGQQQLDQHLERLEVNVGFRRRVHERLARALDAGT